MNFVLFFAFIWLMFKIGPIYNIKVLQECYSECSNYGGLGIETHENKNCIPYSVSNYKSYKPSDLRLMTTSFCIEVSSKDRPWCVSKDSFQYCKTEKCQEIKNTKECHKNTFISSTSSSINLDPFNFSTNRITVVVLYDNDYNCKLYYIHGINMIDSIKQNQFRFCTPYSTLQLSSVNTINKLHPNSLYIIFIIYLISNNKVDEVIRIPISTKPLPPIQFRLLSAQTHGISLIWSNPSHNFNLPLTYMIKCLNCSITNQNQPIKTIQPQNYTKLQPCSKYCFELYSLNSRGDSSETVSQCFYTNSSRSGEIILNKINNDLSSARNVDWIVKGNLFKCKYKFQITYWTGRNRLNSNSLSFSTNNQYIKLDSLERSRIYCIEIESLVYDENMSRWMVGFSNRSWFYTGREKPLISFVKIETSKESKKHYLIKWNVESDDRTFIIGYKLEFVNLKQKTEKYWKIASKKQFCCELSTTPKLDNFSTFSQFSGFEKYLETIFKITESSKSNFTLIITSYNYFGSHVIYKKKMDKESGTLINKSGFIVFGVFLIFLLVFLVLIYKFGYFPVIMKFTSHTVGNLTNLCVANRRECRQLTPMATEIKHNFMGPDKNEYRDALPLVSDNECQVTQKPERQFDYRILKIERMESFDIEIRNFHKKYLIKISNNNTKLIKEYKELVQRTKQLVTHYNLTTQNAAKPENSSKNRFANILPYDQTRILLDNDEYINANYIASFDFRIPNEFIAGQGPIDDSIDNFWLMLWNEKIKLIVMLTRCYEDDKFKCLQYWPQNIRETIKFGKEKQFLVTLLQEKQFPGFVQRKMELFHKFIKEKRLITQIHMTSWSDYSAPNCVEFEGLLLRFHELIASDDMRPYFIHCSAGVGRTGTFITIERLVRNIIQGIQFINIYHEVSQLRMFRTNMVQRQAQYIFIHQFLDYFLDKYFTEAANDESNIYFNQ